MPSGSMSQIIAVWQNKHHQASAMPNTSISPPYAPLTLSVIFTKKGSLICLDGLKYS